MALKALSNDIEKKVTKIINKYYKTNGQNFIEYPEFLDEMVQKLIKSGPLLGVAYDANAEQSASLLQIFSNSEFDIKQSNPNIDEIKRTFNYINTQIIDLANEKFGLKFEHFEINTVADIYLQFYNFYKNYSLFMKGLSVVISATLIELMGIFLNSEPKSKSEESKENLVELYTFCITVASFKEKKEEFLKDFIKMPKSKYYNPIVVLSLVIIEITALYQSFELINNFNNTYKKQLGDLM